MGKLYIIATPIGNLEDITLRALRLLKEVGLIAAEDTRETRKLLARYDIKTPLLSYHEHNKRLRLPQLLKILELKDVALVSEAGMPVLRDPGYELVCAAIENKIQIVTVPGPSAVLAALSISGLPPSPFLFLGYLPRRQGERRSLLTDLREARETLVFFEAPHRLRASLSDMAEVLGERKIALAREITKIHEEVFRGALSQALEYFQHPRGEFTLVVEGNAEEKGQAEEEFISEVKRLKGQGASLKEAIKEVAARHVLSAKLLYKAYLKKKKDQD